MTIGRGSGFTIKELQQRLNSYLKKRNLRRMSWAEQLRARRAARKCPPPTPVVRVRKTDLWSQL